MADELVEDTDNAVIEDTAAPVETPVADKPASGIEPLTERELAIARGEDPDEIKLDEVDEVAQARDESGKFIQGGQADKDVAPGKDAPAGPATSDGAGKVGASKTASWITDDLRELGKSYGLTDEDLGKFPDAASFTGTAAAYDRDQANKLIASQGQAAPAAQETKPAAAAVPASSTEQTAAKANDPAKTDTLSANPLLQKIDREKFVKAGYGEDELALIDANNAKVDAIESLLKRVEAIEPTLQAIQAQSDAREQQAWTDAFHDSADKMDETLYGRTLSDDGKPLQLTNEQNDTRQQLWAAEQAVKQLIVNSTPAGQKPAFPSRSVMLKRAEGLAFGQAIVQREIKARDKQISDQSRRRRPAASRPMRPAGGGVNQPAEPGAEVDLAVEVANNPEVKKLWDKFQEEQGK